MSKNAVFSFFAAYRANELDYTTFYPTINNKAAYAIVKKNILQHNQHYLSNQWDDIERESSGNSNYRPNIIMVTIESFSADFLEYFGNKEQ
ncbi:MAG TPA: LTA synthase family protein, partial [Ferruginibacter sp.]|nr:LTA synthase family protein [Ferruginibacter sp.]